MTNEQMKLVMRIAQHHLGHAHLHLGMLTLGELLKHDTGFTDEQLFDLKIYLDSNVDRTQDKHHD